MTGFVLNTPEQINIFRLMTIKSGVKLEAKGMRLSRGQSCTKLAKQATGLKTNDRQKLIDKLDEIIHAASAARLSPN